MRGLGHQVKTYATNERLSFYAQAHVPDYSVPPPEDGSERPLRKAMNDDEAVLAAMQGLSHELYTFWPELVLFVSGFFTQARTFEMIRSRRQKIVILHTESPYQDDEQLLRAQFADVNLLNDPSNLDEYKAVAPSFYMPHAYDPEVHYPATTELTESDFAFIGTMFRTRQDFFEKMVAAIPPDVLPRPRITLGGSGWDQPEMDSSPLLGYLGHPRNECVTNTETARAYRASRAGINFYRREGEALHKGQGWAMGPREVEMAACGLPFLRDPRPESDAVFPFLPSFSSPEEAADKLLRLLAAEGLRESLGDMARKAIENRTFDNHARELMRILEKQGIRV